MVNFFLSKTKMFCLKGSSQIRTLSFVVLIFMILVLSSTLSNSLYTIYQMTSKNVDMYWYLKDKSSATCIF